MIAALFVETNGCYFNDPRVVPFDITVDARIYDLDLPVVAHPPCQLWGKMAKVNYSRWGGEHNKPGNDGGCFSAALRSVVRCGGVLEHPAQSYAFETYGIPKPKYAGWNRCGLHDWVCEVWQSAYGHRANKKTWLYYYGINPPLELLWNKPKGSHQIGFQDQRGKARNKPTLNKKESNATPVKFKEALIDLAMNSGVVK